MDIKSIINDFHKKSKSWIPILSLIVSMGSAAAIIAGFRYTLEVDEKNLATNKISLTINELDKFDSKWKGNARDCFDYLISLAPNAKNNAYKGTSHLISNSEEDKKKLYDCEPNAKFLETDNNDLQIDHKTANDIKETAKLSLNALEILLSRREHIEKCEMWEYIKSIMNNNTQIKKVIVEFRQNGGCGTDCFSVIEELILNGYVQKANLDCG